MSFQENFLCLRAASGYTQEDVAHRIGVSRQSVAKWEAGKSTPDLEKLIALAELFDVSLDELVRGRIEVSQGEPLAEPPAAEEDLQAEAEDGGPMVDPARGHARASTHDKDAYLAHARHWGRTFCLGKAAGSELAARRKLRPQCLVSIM